MGLSFGSIGHPSINSFSSQGLSFGTSSKSDPGPHFSGSSANRSASVSSNYYSDSKNYYSSDSYNHSTNSYSGRDSHGRDRSDPGFTGAQPVILDLSGGGVAITELSSSNTYQDMTGSGYKNRTAWAGAGSGVLFIDLENSGTIKQANQIIFTKWDPTASSDMQALKHIFDTNHNGKLDTGDARFAAFKIMVTNADGTTTSKTLAQAGVASIDLTENENTRTFSDGSYISGTTTFARTAGGTGTAATVSLAFDPEGFVVRSTTVTNAGTGVVTLDNRAVDSDGSLASETISETSSDGRTQTIRTDLNGDGQIDRVQTNVSVVNESTTTLTRTDKTIFGALLDRIVTTTSVSGRVTTTTISRNANGAVASGNDVISQSEVDTTVNGLTTVKIDDLNFDGSKWHETVTTPSNGGLTSTIEDDIDGNGVFDLTTVTATTVTASTGLRTTTTEDRNSDGSLRDRTVRTASASGLSQTTVSDADGDGLVDLSTSSTIVAGTTSSFATGRTGTTTTTVATSRDGTFLNETKSFVSDDGLAKVTQVDLNGAGTATAPVFTSTTVDVTTIDAATSAPHADRDRQERQWRAARADRDREGGRRDKPDDPDRLHGHDIGRRTGL